MNAAMNWSSAPPSNSVAHAKHGEHAEHAEHAEIVTSTARIWLGADGVIRVVHHAQAKVFLEDAKAIIAAHAELGAGKRHPTMILLGSTQSVDRAARQYLAGEESARVISAVAPIIGSAVARVIANFFVGFNKPAMPFRLFTSEAEALAWLVGFIE